MILVNFGLCGTDTLVRRCWRDNRPESQRIHYRDRPRSHGENVAQNSAHPSSCSLEWLDEGGMIVRFDFEGASPSVANVDDARVLARPLHHQPAARRQPLQMHARRFIRAVLAPHHTENSQLGDRRLTSTKKLFDFLVFFRRQAVFADNFWSDGKSGDCGHEEILLSHLERELGKNTL